MIILKDTIEIKTTPENIFEWFAHLDENYSAWHPDHVKCCWVKGEPAEEGSIFYAEEYLHGKLHKLKFLITKIEPNRKIEFKLLFPMSIICPTGSFIIESREKRCIFTATLSFRFGWLFSKLAKNRVEAIEKHIKEEGNNLKRLLER
ncbi:MAG: SRPBCC family protein [Methanophagales archaeon]|nr:SRPBCC family protein [Methanophagales archaeon]